MLDANVWAEVPFWFWSLVLFTFGCLVGSFLNVCIYRLPRGESIVSPPSHCPHCGYSIPWYLNIPLVTWVYLGGRCANCRAPISVRYLVVELCTGLAFLGCWLRFGSGAPWLALAYCLVLAGFIVATCIDFEHFIIPDVITLGGVVAGFLCSFALPSLHGETRAASGLLASALGIGVGGGSVFLIVQLGKLAFGRQKLKLAPASRIIFTESLLVLPGEEVLYEELFFRKSDTIRVEARTVELPDRCYWNVPVRLRQDRLRIGDEEFNPEEVPHLEVVADAIVLPREAMGLGDVKFMAAIGAFLGWQATLFSLMFSSVLGAAVGLSLIALRKREWSSRLPYGPYIAAAATVWLFAGRKVVALFLP
ncbi:MAG: prepilin peptidase [Verrucomicrobia bacterium]|nr:prepilin peptidase [Verrucomicrobiota bacterium]